MPNAVLFHSALAALGLRPGVLIVSRRRLRKAGHTVTTPDLYNEDLVMVPGYFAVLTLVLMMGMVLTRA